MSPSAFHSYRGRTQRHQASASMIATGPRGMKLIATSTVHMLDRLHSPLFVRPCELELSPNQFRK
eukprot:2215492-Amphidinium_carterae.1